jgi:hypothetical protein
MSPDSPPDASIDFRRQPRKRRPSERNFIIHRVYRSGLRSQTDLARELGLSQRRVSSIVRQVDRWLAAEAESQSDAGSQARLLWRLEQERLKAIIDSAMRCHDQMPQVVNTIRTRSSRAGELQEETRREIEPDAKWLTIALQATRELGRLLQNPPAEPLPLPMPLQPAQPGEADAPPAAGAAEFESAFDFGEHRAGESVGGEPSASALQAWSNWSNWAAPLADDMAATRDFALAPQTSPPPGIRA